MCRHIPAKNTLFRAELSLGRPFQGASERLAGARGARRGFPIGRLPKPSRWVHDPRSGTPPLGSIYLLPARKTCGMLCTSSWSMRLAGSWGTTRVRLANSPRFVGYVSPCTLIPYALTAVSLGHCPSYQPAFTTRKLQRCVLKHPRRPQETCPLLTTSESPLPVHSPSRIQDIVPHLQYTRSFVSFDAYSLYHHVPAIAL